MLLLHVLITIDGCVFLTLSAGVAKPCIKDGTTGHCYQIVDTSTTWTQASEICMRDGGMLTIIESAEEQQFINGQLQTKDFTAYGLWIGSNNLHPESQRQWTNGAKFVYVNWAEGEPDNNKREQNCAEIYTHSEIGSWNDNNCANRRGYICEIAPILSSDLVEPCIKDATTGHCYKIVDTNITWTKAFNVCRSDGGMLVTIESAKEQQFIEGQIEKRMFRTPKLWIGSNKLHPEAQRTWVNGKKFTYVNWAAGEPNSPTFVDENCAEMYTYTMKWNDRVCTDLRGYICENTRAAEPCIRDGVTGHCYQIVNTRVDWTQAFNKCMHDGGMLIIIESAEEQQFIEDQMQKRNFTVSGLWIGSNKLHPEEQRAWTNGNNFSYVNWDEDEPNNNPYENCAEMYTWNMKWNDGWCSGLKGYICENTPAGTSQPQVLIIGVSVGSALVLLVGVLLFYCLIQKRNKYKKKKREEAYQDLQEMEMNREYFGTVEDVYDQIDDLPDTYSTIDDNSVRPNEQTDRK